MNDMDNNCVNLNDVSSDLSRIELYHKVADVLRESNLETVNNNSAPVHPKKSFYTIFGKRFFDFFISLIILIITIPINLIIAIITFFDVGRPIFFKQKRPGKDGKPFVMVKFRNMTNEKDSNGDLLPSAQRVTKFGYFVRKTSLDELLNFWSILKGDMSLIGPRPLDCVYDERLSERHKKRMGQRPGLECPLLHKIDHKVTWLEQFENDVYYVEHVSFLLDVKMVFLLFKMVFNRKSNSMRGASMRGGFMGYEKNGETINAQNVPKKYVDMAIELYNKEKNN